MKVGSSAAKGTPEPCGGGGPLGAGNPPAAGPGTLPSAGKFTGVGGGGPLSRAGSPPAGGPGTLPSAGKFTGVGGGGPLGAGNPPAGDPGTLPSGPPSTRRLTRRDPPTTPAGLVFGLATMALHFKEEHKGTLLLMYQAADRCVFVC